MSYVYDDENKAKPYTSEEVIGYPPDKPLAMNLRRLMATLSELERARAQARLSDDERLMSGLKKINAPQKKENMKKEIFLLCWNTWDYNLISTPLTAFFTEEAAKKALAEKPEGKYKNERGSEGWSVESIDLVES